jgi:hypothetical protein
MYNNLSPTFAWSRLFTTEPNPPGPFALGDEEIPRHDLKTLRPISVRNSGEGKDRDVISIAV